LHNVNPILPHLCFALFSHTNKNLTLLFQYTQVAIFHFQNCNSLFKFSSTLLALVSKNKSKQNQKNWTHTMPMPSFFYGILAPLPNTSTWLPKLQLLSYVKTKTITHTYTSQKNFFWIAKLMSYFKSEESSGFVSLELHMVAPKPILSCNIQNEKKTIHIPQTHYNLSSLQIDMLLPHTHKIKIKIRLSMYIYCMLDSIQTKKSHLLNPNLCLATNKKQCKNIKRLCHSTSAVKLTIDDKFVYNATNCHNKLILLPFYCGYGWGMLLCNGYCFHLFKDDFCIWGGRRGNDNMIWLIIIFSIHE